MNVTDMFADCLGFCKGLPVGRRLKGTAPSDTSQASPNIASAFEAIEQSLLEPALTVRPSHCCVPH